MKLTKYEHACVTLEEQGQKLIVDPGKFTEKLTDFNNISTVVVTHIHSDHFDIDKLRTIYQANPTAQFLGPEQVAVEAKDVNMKVVKAGEEYKVNGFNLSFYGGDHELYEGFQNVGVLVNDTFFHPGDSYTVPDKPLKILGLPASAPWLRVPDTVKYLETCRPEKAFPIHNSLLSEAGEAIHYRIIGEAAKEVGTQWLVLKPGESLEI